MSDNVGIKDASGVVIPVKTDDTPTGLVEILGTSTISIAATADIEAIGNIQGAATFYLDSFGELSVILGAAGLATLEISAIGQLEAKGFLVGSISFSVTAAGDAVAQLGVPGSASISISANGILEGIGYLAGNVDVQIAASLISYALGYMTGNTDTQTGELTADAIAREVWNSLMAEFDTPGTAGSKLNSASAAGDPWTAELPGTYPEGSAGDIVGKRMLTLKKFLALK